MTKQVIAIHGGDSYESYEEYLKDLKNREVTLESFLPRAGWKNNLVSDLGDNFQVLLPRMPNSNNAKYEEWKIWFEKMFPFLCDEVILVGHSQGGIFLVKYLSENIFPKKIKKLLLVSPPHSISDEIGSFILNNSLENVSRQCQDIHLFQSEDDEIVPFKEAEYYKKDIPQIKLHVFKDRGHFLEDHFLELVEEILN